MTCCKQYDWLRSHKWSKKRWRRKSVVLYFAIKKKKNEEAQRTSVPLMWSLGKRWTTAKQTSPEKIFISPSPLGSSPSILPRQTWTHLRMLERHPGKLEMHHGSTCARKWKGWKNKKERRTTEMIENRHTKRRKWTQVSWREDKICNTTTMRTKERDRRRNAVYALSVIDVRVNDRPLCRGRVYAGPVCDPTGEHCTLRRAMKSCLRSCLKRDSPRHAKSRAACWWSMQSRISRDGNRGEFSDAAQTAHLVSSSEFL